MDSGARDSTAAKKLFLLLSFPPKSQKRRSRISGAGRCAAAKSLAWADEPQQNHRHGQMGRSRIIGMGRCAAVESQAQTDVLDNPLRLVKTLTPREKVG